MTLPTPGAKVYQSFVSSITRQAFTMRDTAVETVTSSASDPIAAPVSPRYRIQAIERAVAILNAFTVDDPELGVTELAEKVGLHKSTVHRFMVNLDAAGLVERNQRTGRYRLGLHIFELGGLVMQQMNLWDEALPFLEGLVRDTGETGHLAVLDGGEAIYIERVEARRALRVPSAIGRGYPAHATNLGKVLLADLPRERVAEIVIEKGLASYTPNTITDPDALDAELERIRQRGYAIDDEEDTDGVFCVGSAVFDRSAHCLGAVSITGLKLDLPAWRIEQVGQIVRDHANRISTLLGAPAVEAVV
jgi:Transcriptional regulator